MKLISSLLICSFLLLSANLMASISEIELKEYIENHLYHLNDQLDDLSLDPQSHDSAYLTGLQFAYKNIMVFIYTPTVVSKEFNKELLASYLQDYINFSDELPSVDQKNPEYSYKFGLRTAYNDILKLITQP